MAQVSPDLQHRVDLLVGSIPQEIRKAIDADELEDRVVQAAGLMKQAGQARTPGEGRRLGEQAQRILQARPRAQTEAIVLAKMAKARIVGNSDQADALVRQAREELLAHPPAVRRNGAPVAKAKAKEGEPDTLMAVYDQAGNLTHVGYPKDLTPVQVPPGTTGLGKPRKTGPPAALPEDGPQAALPGDVPGREVIKMSAADVAGLAREVVAELRADPRFARVIAPGRGQRAR